VHETHWLKKHFFDMNIADCTILHSTYRDNPYLTDTDRQQIEYLQQYDHNQYRIYALGEWGLKQNDMAWLHSFDTAKHLRPSLPFMEEFPVYLSFDFNRQPATCIAVQMSPNYRHPGSFVHIIKEFAADVQLSELCARIRHTYPHSILYVTGDASGSRGDVGYSTRHSSYYGMIQNYLGVPAQNMRILSSNLPHNHSRYLLNAIFAEHGGIHLSHQGCPGLINDCIIARVDENTHKPGMLRKDRSTYKMDLFDAMRYFFQAWFGNYNGILQKLYLKPQSGPDNE
jgi:phage terminase large subunit